MTGNAQAIRLLAANHTAQILAGSGADAGRYLTLAWTIEGYVSGQGLQRPDTHAVARDLKHGEPMSNVTHLRPVNDSEPA